MFRLACVVLVLGLSFGSAWADGDVKAGAQKIRTLQCQSCHGKDGISKLPGAPNLAGANQLFGSRVRVFFHVVVLMKRSHMPGDVR